MGRTDTCRQHDPRVDETVEGNFAVGHMTVLSLRETAWFYKITAEEDITKDPRQTLARDGVTANALFNCAVKGRNPDTHELEFDNLSASRHSHQVLTQVEMSALQQEIQGAGEGASCFIEAGGGGESRHSPVRQPGRAGEQHGMQAGGSRRGLDHGRLRRGLRADPAWPPQKVFHATAGSCDCRFWLCARFHARDGRQVTMGGSLVPELQPLMQDLRHRMATGNRTVVTHIDRHSWILCAENVKFFHFIPQDQVATYQRARTIVFLRDGDEAPSDVDADPLSKPLVVAAICGPVARSQEPAGFRIPIKAVLVLNGPNPEESKKMLRKVPWEHTPCLIPTCDIETGTPTSATPSVCRSGLLAGVRDVDFLVSYLDPTLPIFDWRCHHCELACDEEDSHCPRCGHRNCQLCKLRNVKPQSACKADFVAAPGE